LSPRSSALTRPGAPPPAAQAAAVIAHDATEESADFTDAVVIGSATRYAGGTASPSGVSTTAARASAVGSARASTSSASAVLPDRSRPASPIGSRDWSCAFPAEADVSGIDRALVTVRIRLDSSGTPVGAEIVSDPGYGFARAARRCALERRYRPALDRHGQPQPAALTLGVRFER
jgi:protein TonB